MSFIYTQYYLQNSKNNNNFKSNFLLDIDLFNASLYTVIYPKIIIDFILEDIVL